MFEFLYLLGLNILHYLSFKFGEYVYVHMFATLIIHVFLSVLSSSCHIIT